MRWLDKFVMTMKLRSFWKTRDVFYEQLATALENRESMRDFFHEEAKISQSPSTPNPSRAYALSSMLRIMSETDASRYVDFVGPYVPQQDRMMLAAVDEAKGEQRAETLRSLAQAVRDQKLARSVVMGAVRTPLILLPGVAVFAYVISSKAIPVVAKTAASAGPAAEAMVWTPFNALVRTVANGLVQYGWMMALALTVAIAFYFYQLPRWTSRRRYRFEATPRRRAILLLPIAPWVLPLGLYRDFQVGMMLSAMAVMLKAGLTLRNSLEVIRSTSSPWMRGHVRRILVHLEHNTTDYVGAFSKGLLSPSLLARLASTIRTQPQFSEVLIKIGLEGAAEVRKEVSSTAAVLNTTLLIAAGSFLLFLYIGNLSISTALSDALDPTVRLLSRHK